MEFSLDEKKEFLKTFTDIYRNAKGKGPKNIYIKYLKSEIHIVIGGVLSEFEKYLIQNFGQEAIDSLVYYYEKCSYIVETEFLLALGNKYDFKFYELDSDFDNDILIYKMKVQF